MAITNYENAGFNVCIIPIQYFTQNYYYSFDDPGITFGDNLLDFRIEGVENEVFNYSGIRLTVQYSRGTKGIKIYLYNGDTIVFSVDDGNSYLTYGLALGIDDSQHLGYISIVSTISGTRYGIFTAYEYGGLSYYNWIKGIPLPITYQWQSVPTISGKNGILSLAQIKDDYINDGESVSGVSADHFTNLSTENRVDVLIDDALPAPEIGGTTVTVKYTIPSLSTGSYEYCKLVAKKNSMPEGPEDGDKIINIDPSSTSIVIRGLDGLSTYYFVIFIEDDQGNTASSEPKSCKTGESIIPEEIKEYVALINGCNGEGLDFFWKDYTINFPYGGYTDPKSFSYYNMRDVHYNVYNIVPSAFRSGYGDGYRYYTSHTTKFSLWIVNDNGTYKLYFRDYVPFIVGVNCSSFSSDTGLYSSGRYSQDGGSYYFQWYANSGHLVFSTGDDTVQRSDSSLVSLMEWCSKTFRNVNIYLDSVLISPAN